jgi:hypothetical protein
MADAAPALGGWWVPLHHPHPAVVAECTRLREAGDWAAACRAAGLIPDVDLAEVAAAFGGDVARRVQHDLRQFAPDLLRTYLPDAHTGHRSWPQIIVLTDLAAVPAAGAVQPPTEHVLALTCLPSEQGGPGKGSYLRVVTQDALGEVTRGGRWTVIRDDEHWLSDALLDELRLSYAVLPAWCWRADAHDARREAYQREHPQAVRDLVALRNGVMAPHQLHPLAFASLYPGEVQAPSVPGQGFPAVRVRCATVWHEVQVIDGNLIAREHTEQEVRRELALGAMGGPVNGCTAVLRTWRTGRGRLPKRLRWQREFFFRCAREGRGDVVLAMLDAGFDPAVVDGSGATLLHLLSGLDHERVLPKLLAAGLPVDGRDKLGGTPLHHARQAGADDVIAALLAAGADPGPVS